MYVCMVGIHPTMNAYYATYVYIMCLHHINSESHIYNDMYAPNQFLSNRNAICACQPHVTHAHLHCTYNRNNSNNIITLMYALQLVIRPRISWSWQLRHHAIAPRYCIYWGWMQLCAEWGYWGIISAHTKDDSQPPSSCSSCLQMCMQHVYRNDPFRMTCIYAPLT